MTRTKAPFRPFFLLAAADAICAALVWLPVFADAQNIGPSGISAGEWHRAGLLFGTVPAILAGFLLTALPRWTGRPAATRLAVVLLLVLWLCSRVASVMLSPAAGLAMAAIFLLHLLVLAAEPVVASRDLRNLKVILLLLVYGCSAGLTAMSWQPDFAQRTALASIVGLMMIIGGRLVPALTASYAGNTAPLPGARQPAFVEPCAAVLATSALGLWIAAPQAAVSGAACALASIAQLMRAMHWPSWRSGASSVIALHVGYGWIVVGFALLAVQILVPTGLGRAAAIHAWTIGAIGTMGLAVMASMIRRRSGNAFARSTPATAALVAMTGSCILRLPAEMLPGPLALWTALSASLWIAAFCLFLVAFLPMMLRGPCQAGSTERRR